MTAVAPTWACSEPKEPARVDVAVVADSSAFVPITTNLGFEVSLHDAHVAIFDVEFTVAGEVHATLWKRISDSLIPSAFAHPGHYQGGTEEDLSQCYAA